MRLSTAHKGIALAAIGGVIVGLGLADTFWGGWRAWPIFIGTLLGRWLIGKIAGLFFDEELKKLKKRLTPKDPIKTQIWHHRRQHHPGRFKDCRKPACAL